MKTNVNYRVVLRGDRVQEKIVKRKAVPVGRGEKVERDVASGYVGVIAQEDGVYFPGDCLFLSLGDLAALGKQVRDEPKRRAAAKVEESEGRRDC